LEGQLHKALVDGPVSGSVVMKELSIMFHNSLAFCCYWLMME
jgi:hypothetical protein